MKLLPMVADLPFCNYARGEWYRSVSTGVFLRVRQPAVLPVSNRDPT